MSDSRRFRKVVHIVQRPQVILESNDSPASDTVLLKSFWAYRVMYGNKTQSTIIADHINEAMAVEVPVVPLAYLMIMAGVSRTEAIEALKVKSARKIILEHQK